MTQFIRRDQAEQLFEMSAKLTRELVKGLGDLVERMDDTNHLTFINHLLVDLIYGSEILSEAADNIEIYEVKVNEAGASNA